MNPKANTKAFIERPAEGIHTWLGKVTVATLVIMLSMAPSSFAVVIGDWEDSNDGWVEATEGSPVLVPASTVGVTLGSGSLSLTTNGGYWCLKWEGSPEDLVGVTTLMFDLSMRALEWPSTPWTKVADKIAINSDGTDGWKEYTTTTAINRDTGDAIGLDWGAWDPDVNKTYSLDISDYDANGATWVTITISIQGGDGAGHFYFDNARLTPPSPLHVDGNKLKNPYGRVVVLRGVSAIDIGTLDVWDGGVTELIDRVTNKSDPNGNSPGWYTKVIRFLVCPNDSDVTDSPLTFDPHNPDEPNNEATYDLLREAVDYCAEKDIYAIICWNYKTSVVSKVEETDAFWTFMAPRFANDSHVLFEIFNEPNDDVSGGDPEDWLSIRDYMQNWVDLVRTYAPHNLVLVSGANWTHAIGPAATYPIDDGNVVYVSHIYAGSLDTWATGNITTCAAVYPVMVTAWGYSLADANTTDDNWCNGTVSGYAQPLLDFLEESGVGSVAAVASYRWYPKMFDPNWQLLSDEGEFGGFVKDWLYDRKDAERILDLTITKCKIAAGKVQGQDSFDISGTFTNFPDYNGITEIDVSITSLTDEEVIYSETLDCNSSDIASGKLKYSYKIPKGGDGAITSFTIDFNKKTIALKSKSVDLTGLASPLKLDIACGYYTLTGEVNEAVINSKKSIPTRLMRTYRDTLVVTKAKAKNSTTALSDTFSVSGEIAVDGDVEDSNLADQEVNIVWGDQTFTIPAGSLVAAKTGNSYKCSKVTVSGEFGQVTAKFNLDKCTFTVSMKGADLDVTSGDVAFGINFTDFDETADLTLP